MIKIFYFFIPILLLFSNLCFSENGLPFLKLNPSPSDVSMGENITASCRDIYSMCSNPAGLINIKYPQFASSYNNVVEDINQVWFGICFKNDSSSLGIQLNSLNIPPIKSYNAEGAKEEDIQCGDILFGITYSVASSKNMSYGITAKYFREFLDTASIHGIILDTGFIYTLKNINFGITIKNIGQSYSFDKEKDKLPIRIITGISYTFLKNILFEADITTITEENTFLSFGTDIPSGNKFKIRFGWTQEKRFNDSGLRFGFVLIPSLSQQVKKIFNILKFEYTWAGSDITNNYNHRIAFSFEFYKLSPEEKKILKNKKITKNAETKFLEGYYNDAIFEYTKILKTNHEDETAIIGITKCAEKLGITLYKSSETESFTYNELFINAIKLYETSDYIKARDILIQIVLIKVEDETLNLLSQTLDKIIKIKSRNFEDAYDFKKNGKLLHSMDKIFAVLEIEPENLDAKKELDKLEELLEKTLANDYRITPAEKFNIEGFISYKRNEHSIAISSFKKSLNTEQAGTNFIIERDIIKKYIDKSQSVIEKEGIARQIEILLNNGIESYNKKHFVKAKRYFEEVLVLDPENTIAKDYIKKCEIEIEIGKKVREEKKKGKEEKEKPSKTQEKTKTTESYKIEEKIDTSEIDSHYQQGLIYYASGQLEKALEEFEIVLKLDPKNNRAKQAAEKIRKELELNKK